MDYSDVSYGCAAALSGAGWEKANIGEGEAGHTLLNLNADRPFEREHVTYGSQC